MLLFDCGVPLSERTGHQLPLFAFQLFAVQLVRSPEHRGGNNWGTGGLDRSPPAQKGAAGFNSLHGMTGYDAKITIRGI